MLFLIDVKNLPELVSCAYSYWTLEPLTIQATWNRCNAH